LNRKNLIYPPGSDKNSLQNIVGVISLILLTTAYLTHLDFIPLNVENDEARRALVAAEMIISGDYLTPTLNGELYLNKPPLYNWIIAVYFKLSGGYSMFALRLQVIVATLLMGWLVYVYTAKHLDKTVAFFTAFAFMTNGRTLIYDSFLGLIDTTFALFVYLSFMLVYIYGNKKKYFHLFLITYLLTALGFLMKGMPALVFQAITLLTWAVWKRKFKLLFHVSHFAGIGVLGLILGTYYFFYFSRNDIAPVTVFSNLLTESTKRTGVYLGLRETILNLITFPFEILYHFAPWTLFVIALFQRKVWKKIKENDFIHYSFLIFFFNILVYWLSPQVYARYLFMFLPLMYSILFFLFFRWLDESSWQHKTINGVFLFSVLLLALTFTVLPFLDVVKDRTLIFQKCFLLVLVFGLLAWFMIRFKSIRLYGFIIAVIVFRIGFNWYILEPRAEKFVKAEATAATIAGLSAHAPLYILGNSQVGNFDGMSFHIATRRNEILRINKEIIPGAFYITDSAQISGVGYEHLLSFTNYLSDPLMLVKIPENKTIAE